MSRHVSVHGTRGSRTIRSRAYVGRRIAKLIGVVITVLVTALGPGGVVQAGAIEAADWRTGSGLRCATGLVGADLPWVRADTTGIVWQKSVLYREVGVGTGQWVEYGSSEWRFASIAAGNTNRGVWIGNETRQAQTFDSFRVDPGSHYSIFQWAYVDGVFQAVAPLQIGYPGFGPLPFCFA